jgi:phosphate:Na+ symporter
MTINWLDTSLVFLGGLGFFFYGIKQFSSALQAMSGGLIKKVLASLTANRILGVMVGVALTCLVQSSSVITVMTVGFVNAGMMSLVQAISIIFGSNIGTTITGWIIAIKIGKYGIHMIGLGALPMLFLKDERWKKLGSILFALGLIFIGLETMSGAFKPLRSDPGFLQSLTWFSAETTLSLIATIGMGCLLTMLIQSSSAMLGITIALASTGAISFQTAAALVLGENLGTTITALLASVGTSTDARRTALAHAIFNLSGVGIMVVIFPYYIDLVEYSIPQIADFVAADGSKPYIAAHIAASHSLFNISAALVFLPFLRLLASLVTWLIPAPDHREPGKLQMVGDPQSISPVLAISQAHVEIVKMSVVTQKLVQYTREYILDEGNGDLRDKIYKYEEITDNMQKEILLFLCQVMQGPLSRDQSLKTNALLSIADDLESIGDYCQNLARFRKRLSDNQHGLMQETREELEAFLDLIQEAFGVISTELQTPSSVSVDRFDQFMRRLKEQANSIRDKHLQRIQEGAYQPLSGLTFADMVVAMRKISGHLAGINKAVDSFAGKLSKMQ